MHVRNLSAIACLLLASGSAFAQQKATPLTTVSMFRITPEKMGPFMDIMKLFPPALDKLIASGAVLAYGVDSDIVHLEGPNVAFWITSPDYAGVDAAGKAVKAVIAANPEKMKAAWGLTSFGDHRDLLVRSLVSNHGKIPAGALPISDFYQMKVKPGRGATATMLFNHLQKPALDKLVADGTIYGYSLDVEAVHTQAPGTRWLIISLPDLGAKSKVLAAYQAAMAKLSEIEREAMQLVSEDTFDQKDHRDMLSEALIFKAK
jgi:hypothetical protein